MIVSTSKNAGVATIAVDNPPVNALGKAVREGLAQALAEGAKILDERIAQRASDIDVVWTAGYGWPTYLGGPMFWASQTGLPAIVAGLHKHAHRLGSAFSLSPLLERRAAAGKGFESST
jgi:3-hydroxyacyl-CoA dehydrogenase